PTPGSDSSTEETFILPTTSSLCLPSTSRKESFSDFNWPLSSARFLRASAALAKASLRCSSVSVGRGMTVSFSGPLAERREIIGRVADQGQSASRAHGPGAPNDHPLRDGDALTGRGASRLGPRPGLGPV